MTPILPLSGIRVLDDLIPGYAFALAGLIAWSQRPWHRVGTLMVGIGLGLLLGTGPVPTPSPLGEQQNFLGDAWTFFQLVFGLLWAVALFHLLLVFPEGRFVSRLDRQMVLSLYVVVPVSGLALGVLALVPQRCQPHCSKDNFGAIPLRCAAYRLGKAGAHV